MIQVPFVDLRAQYRAIKDEIHLAIQKVLEEATFILGPAVAEFESEFARLHGVRYCFGLSSGTDGNHIALWGLNIQPGDEVIIPANTFIATAWGATLCRATPVFADCELSSYNIDPARIEERITERTKAIVAVHLYGQPADMEPLARIADKRGIHLLEDCAQSHLAEYKGRPVGGFGIASSFSFYPGKNLGAYGEGGAVATNDPALARTFSMIRDHGSEEKYKHEILGHNYRMEAIQGAVLNVKLKYLRHWTEARRSHARLYRELLSGLPEFALPEEISGVKHVYHLFVVRTPYRQRLQEHLRKKGISTGLHYPIPLHLQKAFSGLGYRRGDFPAAELAADQVLSLPMYPELTRHQIEYVAESIREFFD
jgi:dTDP-4-amino-4,6-dideoxygalactose transaminase